MQLRITLSVLVVVLVVATGCAVVDSPPPNFVDDDPVQLEIGADRTDSFDPDAPVNPGDGTPFRLYEIELEEGEAVRVTARAEAMGPGLAMYDPEGRLHGLSTISDVRARTRLIRPAASSGTHLLVVSAPGTEPPESFELTVENAATPGDTIEVPGETAGILWEPGAGPAPGADQRHPYTGGARFSHHLDVDEHIFAQFEARSDDFEPRLTLVDPEEGQILIDKSAGGTETSLRTSLPAGNYQVWVSRPDPGPDGSYELDARSPDYDSPEQFEIGRSFSSWFDWDGPAIQTGPGDAARGRALELTVDEPATIDAAVDAPDFSGVLLLTRPDGSLVEQADSARGEDLDARLVHPLESGKYVLWVTGPGDARGEFELATELRDVPEAEKLELDATVEGRLDDGAVPHRDRHTPVEFYEVELEEDRPLRIGLVSEDFDAHLIVEDETGEVVAENDDADIGTTDAEIERDFEAGRYRIGVTTFVPGERGDYELDVVRAIP